MFNHYIFLCEVCDEFSYHHPFSFMFSHACLTFGFFTMPFWACFISIEHTHMHPKSNTRISHHYMFEWQGGALPTMLLKVIIKNFVWLVVAIRTHSMSVMYDITTILSSWLSSISMQYKQIQNVLLGTKERITCTELIKLVSIYWN